VDMITAKKSMLWKQYMHIQESHTVTKNTLNSMKILNVHNSIASVTKLADKQFNVGVGKIKRHLEKRLNFISKTLEPELLHKNEARCASMHKDIKAQSEIVETLLVKNDINKKCPGDLGFSVCHKIPFKFGNHNMKQEFKYESLRIENKNGLKRNYRLTCQDVIENNITTLNYRQAHTFNNAKPEFKCFTGCKCPVNKPVQYQNGNAVRCVTIRECKAIRLQHVLDKVESDISKSTIDSLNNITKTTMQVLQGKTGATGSMGRAGATGNMGTGSTGTFGRSITGSASTGGGEN